MNNNAAIDLAMIFRRVLFAVSSLFIFCGIFSAILNLVGWRPELGFFKMLMGSHALIVAVLLVIFATSSACRWINRPLKRILIAAAMLTVVAAWHLIDASIHGFRPFALPGSGFAAQSLLLGAGIGLYIVWLYSLEESFFIFESKIHHERLRSISNEKKLLKSRLKLLQAQIEPHFLFNTLTSIVSLDDSNPAQAKEMQINFIRYLRTSLDRTRAGETDIAQEVEMIRTYLEIFKVRMGDRLRYRIDVDEGLGALPFPSMLIQPVVENAIKHGIEPCIEGGGIDIEVRKCGGSICWQIADTGIGYATHTRMGVGLTNVIERIETLYGPKGKFVMEENRPRGMKCTLEVPHD